MIGATVLRESAHAAWKPDPILSISEWADQYRMLSTKASSEAGRWRTSRAPYLREVMDALSPSSPVERVVAMFNSQSGKTEVLLNWLGYVIDQAPAPFLMVQPRVEDAKKYSRQRIDPLIDATPRLRDKVSDARSRDAGNTMFQKEFPGGLLSLTGANSTSGLKSMPAKYLAMDEVDEYKADISEQGDPVSLAEARTSTFARRKIAITSTPTVHGRSKIEAEYEESDQSRYMVPCPECGEMQELRWGNLRWEEDKPQTAKYTCEKCGVLIGESKKTQMLARGVWVAKFPERSHRVRGFFLNALYSPLGWVSWERLVREWLRAQKNTDLLRTFVNTRLAETWKDRGDSPDWERLYNRRELYPVGIVPQRGLVLTAGVDVQKDRLELEVRAWGRAKESWSVDYRVIPGDVSSPTPWRELTKVLGQTYKHESGCELSIRIMAVDSGAFTQHVYDWVRVQDGSRVIATKGVAGNAALVQQPKSADVHVGTKRKTLRVFPVAVDMAKAELYGWLKLPQPTAPDETGYPPGYVHFPQYAEEYFKQLTSEHTVVQLVHGYRKYVWELKTGLRNEALDCAVYARAAVAIIGIDRWSDAQWKALENSLLAGVPVRKVKEVDEWEPSDSYLGDRWRGLNLT